MGITKTKKMKKTEAALILRAIMMTEYQYDERELELMDDIKLKLMNIHPEQIEARAMGKEWEEILTRALITFAILMLTGSLLFYFFA